jgi:hypothetical protein
MKTIDLILEETAGSSSVNAFLLTPISRDAFSLNVPAGLLQQLREWRRRFLLLHDPCSDLVSPDIESNYRNRLCEMLRDWFQRPEWEPLRRTLQQEQFQSLPLRLRCRSSLEGGNSSELAKLPWEESLALKRPIWRLATSSQSLAAVRNPPVRRSRILLLIGNEAGLDFTAEVNRLQELAQQGGVELVHLQGTSSNLEQFRLQLRDRCGWDGLIYLGHSDQHPLDGGRLQFGDGRWLSGRELRQELEQISDLNRRPSFVLLNSCLGLDLADSCLAAGSSWVVCFREMVPSFGASQAFVELLQQLQKGKDLSDAVDHARRQLREDGPAGIALVLSVVCADNAPSLRLHLSPQRQFQQRLLSSHRTQALAAGLCVVLGLILDLKPSSSVDLWLLDRRLESQRIWRTLTGQPGPRRPPLPVLLLDNGRSAAALGVTPTPNRMPRQALLKVLERVSPAAVPVVGLDLVLDEPGPFSLALATRLRQQRRQQVLAGHYPSNADVDACPGSVGEDRTQPIPELLESGLQHKDISTGMAMPRVGKLFPQPLRLGFHLGDGSFAQAIAKAARPSLPPRELPYDSVIDWSLDWSELVTNLKLSDLGTLHGPVLLVGSDGNINPNCPDLFLAPLATRTTISDWDTGAGRGKLPGSILQAVLAQSMAMGHWLTPQLQAPTTALAAGLGWLLAAAVARRNRRWLPSLAVAVVVIPLTLQLGVQQLILLPIALPLLTFASVTLIRHD